MYSKESLERFPFFVDLMGHMDRAAFHDSLTGLIARPYMLGLIRSLIDENVPFTLAMIDLDNFKDINDHYGHRAGDEVLSTVAERLCQYVGDDGVIGRFGGDEFIMIYLKSNRYQDIHAYYLDMFTQSEHGKPAVFRKPAGRVPYITATLGCACFPEDAQDFESLFALMDKALYRGKTKGRNCYIIYVASKHAHLEISHLTKRSLYDIFRAMSEEFSGEGTAEARLLRAFQPMQNHLGLSQLLWFKGDGSLLQLDSGAVLGHYPHVGKLIKNGLYAATNFFDLLEKDPPLCEGLKNLGLESVMLMQVGSEHSGYGYLAICPEQHTMHIWQDDECAAAYVLSSLLVHYLDAQQ